MKPNIIAKALALADAMDEVVWKKTIYKWGDEKEITLFNQNFMIGPVPCNLEVFLSLAYGFDVFMMATLNPASMLEQVITLSLDATDDKLSMPSGDMASMKVIATPYAAVRVGLFVGVGFDLGFAAAKVVRLVKRHARIKTNPRKHRRCR